MNGSNILVTGGAGYIGSHTCKALAAAGFTPIVYDNLVNGHRFAVQWGPFEHGDVLDRGRLDSVMRKYRPAAVMHFAAFAYVGESVADPAKYYRNNVAGSLCLLQAMQENGIGKLVFSSSCAVYGVPSEVPIGEELPKAPINPYGMSKLVVERMMNDFNASYGGESIALRYFNAAGCDPDGDIGEMHRPETHIIPLLLDAVSGSGPAVTIYGNYYDTRDGTCIRDYVHVSDLADAHVKALRMLEMNTLPKALNLGGGTGTSLLELLNMIEKVTGQPVPHNFGAPRDGDPPILVADPTLAIQLGVWQPRIPDLADIVGTAWRCRRKEQPHTAR